MSENQQENRRGALPRFAVILGTNEIASAVAVHLHKGDYGVILSHDPMPPVIRRKMAFHDALYDDIATVAGVSGRRADTGVDIRAGLARGGEVLVTKLGLLDLIVLGSIDLLIDARMNKYQVTPDLRRLARLTIGIGPGFCGGTNCDLAIETRPGMEGRILQDQSTEPPDRVARRLGARAGDRFVHSDISARWHTAIEIGARVYKDFLVGHLGTTPVHAPFDGYVRGVVRDGMEVPAGVKLLELDPRGRKANWTDLDTRAKAIGKAVVKAIAFRTTREERAPLPLHLVK